MLEDDAFGCACVMEFNNRGYAMKKVACFSIAVLAFVGMAHAGGFSVGGHGAYTLGGDIENEDFGYGAQVGVDISDMFSVELSGTMFSEEYDADTFGDLDVDAQHIALTARAEIPVRDVLALYVGGGISYNMFDVEEPSLTDLISTLADPADAEAFAAFTAAGGTIAGGVDIDVDDAIGYHACAGVAVALSDSVELFGEYRFTWMDVEAKGSAEITATLGGVVVEQRSQSGKVDGSYDFGLARVGINILL
jgi:opacity protein-like surface antigen